METRKYLPIPIRFITGSVSYVKLSDVSKICDIHPEMIISLVQLGLIDPVGKENAEDAWTFSVETVPLVRKIIRLRNELGLNYSGVGVVLELLLRIEALEARVRALGDR